MKYLVCLAAALPLAACAATQGNLEDDMLPSAEVRAFQTMDQRLGWQDAAIAWDANDCAIYRGTVNGQVRQRPLMNDAGTQICYTRDASTGTYGNDMLPSAEVRAFQTMDQRLGWQDAAIAWDDGNCAVYRGTVDGSVMSRPLMNDAGARICYD